MFEWVVHVTWHPHGCQDSRFPSRTLHCNKAINVNCQKPHVSCFKVTANFIGSGNWLVTTCNRLVCCILGDVFQFIVFLSWIDILCIISQFQMEHMSDTNLTYFQTRLNHINPIANRDSIKYDSSVSWCCECFDVYHALPASVSLWISVVWVQYFGTTSAAFVPA